MADAEQTLERQVQDMIHAFVLEQLQQSSLVRDGKLRTDEGYHPELVKLTDRIVKKVYEY